MRSLKKLNQALGTNYTRWEQVIHDLDQYHAIGASLEEWERTSGPPKSLAKSERKNHG